MSDHQGDNERIVISAPAIYRAALLQLADLDAHSNISAAVRKLVDEKMKEIAGPDWKTQIAAMSHDAAGGPAISITR